MTRSKLFLLALFLLALSPAAAYAQARPKVVKAEDFPGADIGAKINAAVRALGAQPGEVWVSSGGVIRTQVIVGPGHTLRLKGGVYPSTVAGPTILLENDSALVADSWDAVLEETTSPTMPGGLSPTTGLSVFTIVQDKAGAHLNGAPTRGIRVEGVHFRGARKDFNSALQTVSLGNCVDCRVVRNWLENTRTIGIQIGGGSALGNYARNVVINDNLLTGVASQNIAVTNAVKVEIRNNRSRRGGQPGGPGVSVIDVEPNVGDRVEDIVIADNHIDATESAVDTTAKVTNGIVVNNGNGANPFRNVQVINNIVLGQPVGREIVTKSFSGISYAAVLVRSAAGVLVRGNKLYRSSRCIVIDTDSTDTRVENNELIACGSGGTVPISVEDSSRNVISRNILRDEPGDPYNLGDRALFIVELGRSDSNLFEGNRGAKVQAYAGRRSRVTP